MAARVIKNNDVQVSIPIPVAQGYMHTIFINDVVLGDPPGVVFLYVSSKVATSHRDGDARWTIMETVCRDLTVFDVAVAPRVYCYHNRLSSEFQLENNFHVDERCVVKLVGNQQSPNDSPRKIKKTQESVKMEVLPKYLQCWFSNASHQQAGV